MHSTLFPNLRGEKLFNDHFRVVYGSVLRSICAEFVRLCNLFLGVNDGDIFLRYVFLWCVNYVFACMLVPHVPLMKARVLLLPLIGDEKLCDGLSEAPCGMMCVLSCLDFGNG